MVSNLTKAKDAVTDAAQRGAQEVKIVASDALGAAARAATGVVLEAAANALASGEATVKQQTPAMKRAAGRAASFKKPARKKTAAKKKKTSAKKKTAKKSAKKAKKSKKKRL